VSAPWERIIGVKVPNCNQDMNDEYMFGKAFLVAPVLEAQYTPEKVVKVDEEFLAELINLAWGVSTVGTHHRCKSSELQPTYIKFLIFINSAKKANRCMMLSKR